MKDLQEIIDVMSKSIIDLDINREQSECAVMVFCFHSKGDNIDSSLFLGGHADIFIKSLIQAGKEEKDLDGYIAMLQESHDMICEALLNLKLEQDRRIKNN